MTLYACFMLTPIFLLGFKLIRMILIFGIFKNYYSRQCLCIKLPNNCTSKTEKHVSTGKILKSHD